jgi:hypothetical protein
MRECSCYTHGKVTNSLEVRMRNLLFLAAISLFLTTTLSAQSVEVYDPPRTEYDHPDLQGSWSSRSITPLERPTSLPNLIITTEEAEAYAEVFVQFAFNDFADPDTFIQNITNMNEIYGELRSSAIINPENGRIPFSEIGLQVVAQVRQRDLTLFDHPEQRPLDERCLGSVLMS